MPAVTQVPAQAEAGHAVALESNSATVHSMQRNCVADTATSDVQQFKVNGASTVWGHADKATGHLHRQGRSVPSATPQTIHEAYPSDPAESKPARSPPAAFPQLTHEAHAYSLFAQRDQATFVYKPGPSAFPQLPHEAVLQQAAADQHPSLSLTEQSMPDPHAGPPQQQNGLTAEQQAAAWNVSAEQPAGQAQAEAEQGQADSNQKEANSEEGPRQDGLRQYVKSHHGGYMQRGGHERLPHRRTTRSMLRGADVQTGTFTHRQWHVCRHRHGIVLLPPPVTLHAVHA